MAKIYLHILHLTKPISNMIGCCFSGDITCETIDTSYQVNDQWYKVTRWPVGKSYQLNQVSGLI